MRARLFTCRLLKLASVWTVTKMKSSKFLHYLLELTVLVEFTNQSIVPPNTANTAADLVTDEKAVAFGNRRY